MDSEFSLQLQINSFVENPEAFLEICEGVLTHLKQRASQAVKQEEEVQLREVSKTIQRLEKQGISVPAALRQEKSRLITVLACASDEQDTYRQFIERFEALVGSATQGNAVDDSAKKERPVRSRNDARTGRVKLKEQIVLALRKLGGKGHFREVFKIIEQEMDGQLLEGDLEWSEAHSLYLWQ